MCVCICARVCARAYVRVRACRERGVITRLTVQQPIVGDDDEGVHRGPQSFDGRSRLIAPLPALE